MKIVITKISGNVVLASEIIHNEAILAFRRKRQDGIEDLFVYSFSNGELIFSSLNDCVLPCKTMTELINEVAKMEGASPVYSFENFNEFALWVCNTN